jgi:hypothetical protein
MRIARVLVWCVAAICGAISVARFLIGPFGILGIAVNSPLNPEGVFGALVTFLIATRPRSSGVGEGSAPWPVFAAAGVAVVALHSALYVYFLSDDFIIVNQARSWTSANLAPLFTSAGGDGFFRPLGYLSFVLDSKVGGTNPVWWHFTTLMLHMANSGMVALLAARWGLSVLPASAAGMLFALHGTHLESAVWVAGRFDLLATFFVLATLLLFGRNTTAAIVCSFAALCSKESAYVLPGLIALMAWHEKRGWRSTIPYFVVTGIAFVYRWILLGGIGGYREQSGAQSFYSLKLATTAKVVFARLWTSLYFPINWTTDPARWTGWLALAYVATLLCLALRARPAAAIRLGLLSLVLAILPPLHLLGGAADLSGGRLLYLPSVFFCLMLAASTDNLSWRGSLVTSVALLTFHGAALLHDLPFWHAVGDRVEAICTTAAENGTTIIEPPKAIYGVPALANGSTECVDFARH